MANTTGEALGIIDASNDAEIDDQIDELEDRSYVIDEAMEDYPEPVASEAIEPDTADLQTTMKIAQGVDSSHAAKVKALSKKWDIPPSVVESDIPRVEAMDKNSEIDFAELETKYPGTSAFLKDPANASIYKSHIRDLQAYEDLINEVGSGESFYSGMGTTIPEGLNKTFQGIKKFFATDLSKGQSEDSSFFGNRPMTKADYLNPPIIDVDSENAKQADEQAYQDSKLEFFNDAIKNADESIAKSEKLIQENTPKLSPTMQGVRGGIESFIVQSPLIAASAITKSAAPMTLGMGSMAFGDSYAEGTSKGLDHDTATFYASINATSELVTEYGPAKLLTGMFKDVGSKQFGKKIGKWFATEAVGEQINTIVNSVNDYHHELDEQWKNATTWQEKAKIQAEKQYVTLVSTAVQGGITSTGMGALNYAVKPKEIAEKIENDVVGQAMQSANEQDRLDQSVKLMQSVMEQSPEAGTEFFEGLQEQYPDMPKEVYISSRDLQEAFDGGDLAVNDPNIETFYQDVLQGMDTNEDISIPLQDYAMYFADNGKVRENVRLSEDGMSILDMQNAEPALQAVTSKMIDQAKVNAEGYEKSQEIFNSIQEQLYGTGTLKSREAKLSAQLMPALMQRHAEERGISLKEAYETIPGVKIQASESEGDVLLQAKESGYEGADKGEATEWTNAVAKGLDMSQEGRMQRAQEMGFDTENTFYHGTSKQFDEFSVDSIGSASDSGMFGKGFYFGNEQTANGYAKGEGANVVPVYLKMDNPYVINKKEDIPDIQIPSETMEDLENADNLYSEKFTEQLKEQGYDGVIDNFTGDGGQRVVFDSSQIRSTSASFDPDHKDSANLLAQSENKITVFRGGKNKPSSNDGEGSTQYGKGAYFSSNGVAQEYAGERDGEVSEYKIELNNPWDEYAKSFEGEAHDQVKKTLIENNLPQGFVDQNYEPGQGNFTFIANALSNFNKDESGKFSYFGNGPDIFNKILRDAGFDGVIGEYQDTKQYAVFNDSQIINSEENALYQSKQAESGGVSYEKDDFGGDKNLYVAHNLSEENLLHADELGGLASPSLAVARIDKDGFDSFGNITLIADPEMAVKNKARAFNADIYSPRHPRHVNFIDSKANKEYQKFTDDRLPPEFEDSGAEALERNFSFQRKYFEGVDKLPKKKKKKADPIVKKYAKKYNEIGVLSDKDSQTLEADIIKHFEKLQNEMIDKSDNDSDAEFFKTIYFDENGVIRPNPVRELKAEIQKYYKSRGMDNRQFKIDVQALARKPIHKKGIKKLAKEWEQRLVSKKKLFKGYTNSGDRKYADYTLENVVREMRKELQDGEGFNYGIPNIRAKNAKEFTSTATMQWDRDQIVKSEEFEAIKKETDDKYEKLIDDMAEFYNGDTDSYQYRENASYALADYDFSQFDLSPEVKAEVDGFLGHLRNMPTEYFESKVQRAVDLSEFHTAVIPNGASKEVIDVLKRKGLNVKKYKDAEGKRKAIEQTGKLFQENRASIQRTNGEYLINLGKQSDRSSFLHEAGHMFLDIERIFAEKYGVSDNQKAVLEYLNVDNFDDIDFFKYVDMKKRMQAGEKIEYTAKELENKIENARDKHELFATSFESYLQTGRAPSVGLREAFRNFKQWLVQVYQGMKPNGISLTKDVTDMFDRLLATEDQIAEMEAVYNFEPDVEATESAKETLTSKLFKELHRMKSKEWAQEKDQLEIEIKKELEETDTYKAEQYIKAKGTKLNEQQVAEALGYREPKMNPELDPTKDSLLIAIAKVGGLDREEAFNYGVDPANWKGRKNFSNSLVHQKPVFRDKKGKLFSDLIETLGTQDNGYVFENENELIDAVHAELAGQETYSNRYEPDLSEYYQEDSDTSYERKPKRLYGSTEKDGLDIDVIAPQFNFDNGEQMLVAIAESKQIDVMASEMAQEEMLANYGDILNDGTLDDLARDEAFSESRGRALLKELKSLNKRAGTGINHEMLKRSAQDRIAAMPVYKLMPEQYHRKEVKAGQEYQQYKLEGDQDMMVQAKMDQIINSHLYREAKKAKVRVESQRKKIVKVRTKSENTSKINPEYARIRKIYANQYALTAKDFKEGSESLSDVVNFINNQLREGEVISGIDPFINEMLGRVQRGESIDGLKLPSYKDLTVEQMQNIVDQLDHFGWIGRRLSEDENAQSKAEVEQVKTNFDGLNRKDAEVLDNNSRFENTRKAFRGFIYDQANLFTLITEMDGTTEKNAHSGFLYKKVYKKIMDATNERLRLRSEAIETSEAIFQDLQGQLRQGKSVFDSGKKSIIKDNGQSWELNRQERIMLAVYNGSMETRERLYESFEATDADIAKHLAKLTDKEIDIVQKIWEWNESYWPALKESERDVNGVVPPRVKPESFYIGTRKLDGGYMRIFYKEAAQDAADRDRQLQNEGLDFFGGVSQTKTGAMKARTGSGGRGLDLQVNNVFRAIDDNIEAIAFQRTSVEIMRLVNRKDFAETVSQKFGIEFYKTFLANINQNFQRSGESNWFSKLSNQVYSNMSIAFLSFSARNFVQQPVAATNFIPELGVDYIKGAMAFYSDFRANRKMINEKSIFMKNRSKVVNKETNIIMNKLETSGLNSKIKEYAFAHQTVGDLMVAYPAWLTMYKRSMNTGMKDGLTGEKLEKFAVDQADEIVTRNIGSGQAKDMAPMLAGSGIYGKGMSGSLLKPFTFMGSFANMQFNLVYRGITGTKQGKKTKARFMQEMAFYIILPGILMKYVLGEEPEDEENKMKWLATAIADQGSFTTMLLRDLNSAWKGFGGNTSSSAASSATVRLLKDAMDISSGEKELEEKVPAIIRSLGIVTPFGYGANQIARSIEGNQDSSQNFYEANIQGKYRPPN